MRELTPKQAAKRIARWAKTGISLALVDSLKSALDVDRRESATRAPHRSGALAGTIRVTEPSSTKAAQTGLIKASLSAGRRSVDRRKAVPYARVLQTGQVYGGPGGKTKPHPIVARRARYNERGTLLTTGVLSFVIGGRRVFTRSVRHPGSRFRALGYLRVNEPRLQHQLDRDLGKDTEKEIG